MANSLESIRTSGWGFVNYVYLIIDKATKKTAIVDPSWEYDKIISRIEDLQLEPEMILLTHSHWDHINLAPKISKKYNIPIYISAEEKKVYNLTNEIYEPLQDQKIILLGENRILCLLTPGHTLGSMCFISDEIMLSGDTIFMEGCGICENYKIAEMMFESVQRIKNEISRNVNVYAGHRYNRDNGQSLAWIIDNNIYFDFKNKDDFINFLMRKRNDLLGSFR